MNALCADSPAPKLLPQAASTGAVWNTRSEIRGPAGDALSNSRRAPSCSALPLLPLVVTSTAHPDHAQQLTLCGGVCALVARPRVESGRTREFCRIRRTRTPLRATVSRLEALGLKPFSVRSRPSQPNANRVSTSPVQRYAPNEVPTRTRLLGRPGQARCGTHLPRPATQDHPCRRQPHGTALSKDTPCQVHIRRRLRHMSLFARLSSCLAT